MHAALRGEEPRVETHGPDIGPDRLLMDVDVYEAKPRAEREILSPEARLANPLEEIDKGITDEAALDEVARCFSCGILLRLRAVLDVLHAGLLRQDRRSRIPAST